MLMQQEFNTIKTLLKNILDNNPGWATLDYLTLNDPAWGTVQMCVDINVFTVVNLILMNLLLFLHSWLDDVDYTSPTLRLSHF